jgi:SulP family sulfate permease
MKTFQIAQGVWQAKDVIIANAGIASLCMGLILQLGKMKIPFNIPAQLIAIVISTLVSSVLKLPIKTLAEFGGRESFLGGSSSFPSLIQITRLPVDGKSWQMLLASAVGVAAVCIAESLLALRISFSTFKRTSRETGQVNADKSIIGLGIGSFISALFGGFGGCGLIPNTFLNNINGGIGILSVYAYSIFMILSVVVFAPLIGMIPMSALTGLMTIIAFRAAEIKESEKLFRKMFKSPQSFFDSIAMVATTLIATNDMGLGIAVGVLLTKVPYLTSVIKNSVYNSKEASLRAASV